MVCDCDRYLGSQGIRIPAGCNHRLLLKKEIEQRYFQAPLSDGEDMRVTGPFAKLNGLQFPADCKQ